MELKIFNKNIDFIGIVDTFTSFRYNHKFYDIGQCELHIPFSLEALEVLDIDNFIYVNSKNSFIIHTRQINLNKDGSEYIQVIGKSLLSVLDRRIIYKQIIEKNNNVNNLTTRILNENVILPTDINRKIDFVSIGNLVEVGNNIDYQNTYGNVLEEVLNISKTNNISFYFELDYVNKLLKLNSFKGTDRSLNQSIVSPCIFSQDFENIEEQEYTNSLENYKNITLVAGAGEGVLRKLKEVGNGTGLDRKELFTDSRDLSDKEQKTRLVDDGNGGTTEESYEVDLPIEEYNKMLEQRGKEKLEECKKVETFESKISLLSNFKYDEDFSIGDIVTVSNKKWNLIINTKITEVEEVWEETKSMNITFGDNIPTLLDKIKIKMR